MNGEMGRKLVALLRLDGLVAIRHRFVHVVAIMALVFGALVRFALPEKLQEAKHVVVFDRQNPQVRVVDGLPFVATEQALREALGRDREAIGVILEGPKNVTLVGRGHETERMVQLEETAAAIVWARARGVAIPTAHSVTVLGASSEPVPFPLSFVPLLFAMDVVILGFLFGAAMILQEKTFGTLRYHRTTPSGPGFYLLSKLLVNLVLSLLGAMALVAVAMPRGLVNAPALALVLIAAAGITLFGMGLAAFFDSLSSFFYPLVLVGKTLSAPAVTYFVPSLDVPFLHVFPTHHAMFGTRELLFPTGKTAIVREAFIGVLAFLALAAPFAYLAVSRRLYREVA